MIISVSDQVGLALANCVTSAYLRLLFVDRFLGYKGMLVVDERLDGIRMRLRPSMRKFVVDNGDDAWLEIARAFDRPNSYALNR